jgi:tetrahydromethanopterin S-methyltransferase subunit A
MPNPLFRPPRHLIKEWPEVFEDLYMNTMPVAYLEHVHLEFTNGRVWQINIKDQLDVEDPDDIADKLLDTLQEYKNDIEKIDFKVDIEKLKKDIQNSTKDLF